MNNSDRYRWLKLKDPAALCRIAAAAASCVELDEMQGNVDAMIDAAMGAEQARASDTAATDSQWPWS